MYRELNPAGPLLQQRLSSLQGNGRGFVREPLLGAAADGAHLLTAEQKGKQGDGECLEQQEGCKHLPSDGARPPAHEHHLHYGEFS